MYKAYLAGRLEKDPSESWYAGEIGFFDFYSTYSPFEMTSRIVLACSGTDHSSICGSSSSFFEIPVIPLAKKLETCGVFGVSSDEYLNYAEQNRREWVDKGQDIVQAYLKSYQK